MASDPEGRGVDHLLFGAARLEEGVERIAALLGVRPVPGGRHPAYGTRNALAALGPTTYLEVIAPDPELEPPEKGLLFGLDELPEPRLVTWVHRDERIEEVAARAAAAGLALGSVEAGCRDAPDGTVLEWRLTDPRALPMGGVVPFLIAWGDTPHPARSAPPAGTLVRLRLEHPEPDRVRRALEALGASAEVSSGPEPALAADIRTPAGIVELR